MKYHNPGSLYALIQTDRTTSFHRWGWKEVLTVFQLSKQVIYSLPPTLATSLHPLSSSWLSPRLLAVTMCEKHNANRSNSSLYPEKWGQLCRSCTFAIRLLHMILKSGIPKTHLTWKKIHNKETYAHRMRNGNVFRVKEIVTAKTLRDAKCCIWLCK